MLRVALLFLLSVTAVWNYPQYRDAIPNGHVVPNPCYKVKGGQELWQGVGHKSISGGGELNPFGKVRLGFELSWTGGMWEVRFFYEPFWEGEIGIWACLDGCDVGS